MFVCCSVKDSKRKTEIDRKRKREMGRDSAFVIACFCLLFVIVVVMFVVLFCLINKMVSNFLFIYQSPVLLLCNY